MAGSRSKGPRKKRVLIADDNATYRRALRSVVGRVPSVEVVGEASGGAECLQLVESLSPDVVLLDVNMPEPGGLELTRRLKSRPHAPCVVVLSLSDDGRSRDAAFSAGADAYVPKAAAMKELVPMLALDVFPSQRPQG